MQEFEVRYQGRPSYKICITNSWNDLADKILELGKNWGKVCIVSDSNVAPLYLSNLLDCLNERKLFTYVSSFVFEAGEEHKNLEVVQDLYAHLIEEHFDRKDLLIALGGGVVGDLTGFAAATYLRGIDFIQVPTTLLSQVDSSIGGKTGVDFRGFKNMVGAFKMPKLVYMNNTVLSTLPPEQVASGMGEVVKYGLIRNREFFYWLNEHNDDFQAMVPETLNQAIFESCQVKKEVVEADPEEAGIRAILNFGHTIGHAVEKLMNFKLAHGQCVAIGSCAAAFLSMQRGLLTEEAYHSILMTLQNLNLPTRLTEIDENGKLVFQPDFDENDILEASKNDKKRNGNKIRFILLSSIGNGIMMDDVSDEEILLASKSIL